MLTPELAVTQVGDTHMKYIVKFVDNSPRPVGKFAGEAEAIEYVVTIKEHEKMMVTLRMYSLADFAERFREVCDYYMREEQYVEFEEIKE